MSATTTDQSDCRSPTELQLIFGLVVLVGIIIWKIVLFRHAARTSNGWEVFSAMLITPFERTHFTIPQEMLNIYVIFLSSFNP